MGCGSSTAAAGTPAPEPWGSVCATVPASGPQNFADSAAEPVETQPRPHDTTAGTAEAHNVSSTIPSDPKPTGESMNIPASSESQVGSSTAQNDPGSTPTIVLAQQVGRPQESPITFDVHEEAAQPKPQTMSTSQGAVVDRVNRIASKDDDVFGEPSDVLADAEKLLGHMPAAEPVVSIQQGTSKDSEDAINPLSHSFDAVDGGWADVKPEYSRQSSSNTSARQAGNFTDIANKGSSALPALNSMRQNQNWRATAALDQFGETDEVLVITPPAAEHTEVTHFEHIAEEQDSEEEDGFDANAIAAPKFNELPAVRESAAYQTASSVAEGPVAMSDPDDPWESLQTQYRIRADARSPAGRPTKAKASSQPQDTNDYELILDEDARVNPVRHVRKESGRGRTGTKHASLPPKGSGPKAANWGDGVMAQAGDIMLGRGALDEDYVPTDMLSFGGNGESNFSAGYVEYSGNEQSFDLDGTYMEVPKPPDVHDIAMEDFTDDLMASMSAEQKPLANVKPSLAEKLRQFEAQFDDDEYADEDIIREEMRLMASSKNL